MQRFLASLFLLCALGAAHAQSIQITTANGPCTYPTGAVTSDPATGQLLATVPSGQSPSGTGCGTSGTSPPVTFGPASPLTATTSTTVVNSGGSVSFAFQPLNATSCLGTITPSTGTALTNPICTGSACNAAQTFSATFPPNTTTTDATYSVAVACTGAGSITPVQSQTSPIVTVQKTGTVQNVGCTTSPTLASTTAGIPNFTMLTGNVAATYFGGSHASPVLATEFDSIYAPWPGNASLTAVINLPTNNYLSEHFKVPPNFFASRAGTTVYGEYTINGSGFSAAMSMSISKSCGDFSDPSLPGSTVVPGCLVNKHNSLSAGPLQWRNNQTCILADNTDYYLNIINADIHLLQPNGGGTAASTKNTNCSGTCSDPVSDGPTSGL